MMALIIGPYYYELLAVLTDTVEASGGLIRWQEGVPIRREDGWYQATVWLPRSSRITAAEVQERAEKRLGNASAPGSRHLHEEGGKTRGCNR
jgi:hypothetical protein